MKYINNKICIILQNFNNLFTFLLLNPILIHLFMIIIYMWFYIHNVDITYCEGESNRLEKLETLLAVNINEHNKTVDAYEFYVDLFKQVENQPVVHKDILEYMRERAWEKELLVEKCYIKISNTVLNIREINPNFKFPVITKLCSEQDISHLIWRSSSYNKYTMYNLEY